MLFCVVVGFLFLLVLLSLFVDASVLFVRCSCLLALCWLPFHVRVAFVFVFGVWLCFGVLVDLFHLWVVVVVCCCVLDGCVFCVVCLFVFDVGGFVVHCWYVLVCGLYCLICCGLVIAM